MRPSDEYLATLTLNTQEYIRDLEAENKRLAAIVDRLPKTTDGVPITPGMTVWTYNPGYEEEILSYIVARIALCDKGDWWIADKTADTWQGGMEPDECYSTEQAAREAEGGKP